MEPQPVKCLCCDTWNSPEAKFCKNCGEELEIHRKLQQIEQEIEIKEKILNEWAALEDEEQQQSSRSGCASTIILLISISGVISLCL